MNCAKGCPSAVLQQEIVRTGVECGLRRAAFEEAWQAHSERSKRRAEAIDVLALENADLRRQVEMLTRQTTQLQQTVLPAAVPSVSVPTQTPPQQPPQVAIAAAMPPRPAQRTVKIQTSASLLDTSALRQQQQDAAALQKRTEERALRVQQEADEVTTLLQYERQLHHQQLQRDTALAALVSAEVQRRSICISEEAASYADIITRTAAAWVALCRGAAASEARHASRRFQASVNAAKAVHGVVTTETTARAALVGMEAQQRQSLVMAFAAELGGACARLVQASHAKVANATSAMNQARHQLRLDEARVAEEWRQLEAQRGDLEAVRALLKAESILASSPTPTTPPQPQAQPPVSTLRQMDPNAGAQTRAKSLELEQRLQQFFGRLERVANQHHSSVSFNASDVNRSAASSREHDLSMASTHPTPPPRVPAAASTSYSGYHPQSSAPHLHSTYYYSSMGQDDSRRESTPDRPSRGVPERGRSATVGAAVTLHSPLSLRKTETPSWGEQRHHSLHRPLSQPIG